MNTIIIIAAALAVIAVIITAVIKLTKSPEIVKIDIPESEEAKTEETIEHFVERLQEAAGSLAEIDDTYLGSKELSENGPDTPKVASDEEFTKALKMTEVLNAMTTQNATKKNNKARQNKAVNGKKNKKKPEIKNPGKKVNNSRKNNPTKKTKKV